MHRLSQPVCLMIGAQALCLAVGFWFQYQMAISTAEHEAYESAWSELAVRSQPIVSAAKRWQPEDFAADAPERTRTQALLDSASGADQSRLLLTDASGKILCRSGAEASAPWQVGNQIAWHCQREARTPGEPRYGRLETPDGEFSAIVHPPVNGGVQVVAYAAVPIDSAAKTALLAALPQASGIAFVWTLGLCAGATYLLTARFNFQETHRREQRDHAALQSAQDLLRTRDAVIFGLAKLAESRDPETGDHLERISLYTNSLATAMRSYPKFQRIVTPNFIRLLGISSVLHDIGKVGLEDTVLLKPGRLTEAERKVMQQHTLVAGDCLKEIEQRLGASNFLQTAREIALHHHERWDGTGYPTGLAGEAIPLAARIVSICDVYDALRSKRVYKAAFPHEDCVRAIRDGAGTQFDPDLVEVFLEIESEFAAIAIRFANDASAKAERLDSQGTSGENRPDRMSAEQEATLREVIGGPQPLPESARIGIASQFDGHRQNQLARRASEG